MSETPTSDPFIAAGSREPRPETGHPRVRVVVLNYNGRHHVLDCIERLVDTDWPTSRLELVVVDNASGDGSADEIERRFPQVRVIRSRRNRGFGAGNNLALRDLHDIDYVALLNNDAFVDRGWLHPLVDAMEEDGSLGAASPKILLAPRFSEVEIHTDEFLPGGPDERTLGLRVSGVRVRGSERWNDTVFADGWFEVERNGPLEPTFRWCKPDARLWVPRRSTDEDGDIVALRIAAERTKDVVLRSGEREITVRVGPDPRWVEFVVHGETFDVLNNSGSLLVEDGYGADRGFLERDDAPFASPAEVFAWCGCCVLLSKRYLEEIGLFDERFFLYYEDFDLSWRGRSRGWRYLYMPTSTVRHMHATTSVKGSRLFEHYVERNRLVMLTKNAPRDLVVRSILLYLRAILGYARRDVLGRVRHGERPEVGMIRSRLGAFAAYTATLPRTLFHRWRIRRVKTCADDDVVGWMVLR